MSQRSANAKMSQVQSQKHNANAQLRQMFRDDTQSSPPLSQQVQPIQSLSKEASQIQKTPSQKNVGNMRQPNSRILDSNSVQQVIGQRQSAQFEYTHPKSEPDQMHDAMSYNDFDHQLEEEFKKQKQDTPKAPQDSIKVDNSQKQPEQLYSQPIPSKQDLIMDSSFSELGQDALRVAQSKYSQRDTRWSVEEHLEAAFEVANDVLDDLIYNLVKETASNQVQDIIVAILLRHVEQVIKTEVLASTVTPLSRQFELEIIEFAVESALVKTTEDTLDKALQTEILDYVFQLIFGENEKHAQEQEMAKNAVEIAFDEVTYETLEQLLDDKTSEFAQKMAFQESQKLVTSKTEKLENLCKFAIERVTDLVVQETRLEVETIANDQLEEEIYENVLEYVFIESAQEIFNHGAQLFEKSKEEKIFAITLQHVFQNIQSEIFNEALDKFDNSSENQTANQCVDYVHHLVLEELFQNAQSKAIQNHIQTIEEHQLAEDAFEIVSEIIGYQLRENIYNDQLSLSLAEIMTEEVLDVVIHDLFKLYSQNSLSSFMDRYEYHLNAEKQKTSYEPTTFKIQSHHQKQTQQQPPPYQTQQQPYQEKPQPYQVQQPSLQIQPQLKEVQQQPYQVQEQLQQIQKQPIQQQLIFEKPIQQPIQQPIYEQPIQQPIYQQPIQYQPVQQQPIYQQPIQQQPINQQITPIQPNQDEQMLQQYLQQMMMFYTMMAQNQQQQQQDCADCCIICQINKDHENSYIEEESQSFYSTSQESSMISYRTQSVLEQLQEKISNMNEEEEQEIFRPSPKQTNIFQEKKKRDKQPEEEAKPIILTEMIEACVQHHNKHQLQQQKTKSQFKPQPQRLTKVEEEDGGETRQPTEEETNRFNSNLLKIILAKSSASEPTTMYQIKEIIYQGIDASMRKSLWKHCIFENKRLIREFPKKLFKETLIKQDNCAALVYILKDVPRTFKFNEPQSELQEAVRKSPLTNILVAYANIDKEIGYMSGMSYIAGSFYQVFNSEYMAFIALVHIMKSINWRMFYLRNVPKLSNLLQNIDRRVQRECSNVYNFFKEENVMADGLYTQMIMTIGQFDITADIALYVMDFFLLDGEKVLYNVLLNCFKINEHKILNLSNASEIYEYIHKDMIAQTIEKHGIREILEDNS